MKYSIRLGLVACALAAGCRLPEHDGTAASGPERSTIRVQVAIDFGPAGRSRLAADVTLPRGSTPVDAGRALAPVVQDWLCCAKDDVWSIGGVDPDPRLDRYWFWRVDGQAGPTAPVACQLEDGDRVEWIYRDYDAGVTSASAEGQRAEPRVISLLPAATEIVRAVGGESFLVGISHLCTQPEGQDLPRVLSTTVDSEADMTRIAAAVREHVATKKPLYELDQALSRQLAPTLVISQGLCPVCAATLETAAPLRAEGHGHAACPELLVLSPRSLADVEENIRQVGAAIGRVGAGRVAARALARRIEEVRALPASSPRPRVAVLEWFEPLWLSGEWIAEMVEVAGGEPLILGPNDASRRVGWDELAAAEPDAIVLAPCSMSVARAERELGLLRGREEWQHLRAVRSGRVFLMDGGAHFSTPGPRLADGIACLAAILRDLDGAAPADRSSWKRIDGG